MPRQAEPGGLTRRFGAGVPAVYTRTFGLGGVKTLLTAPVTVSVLAVSPAYFIQQFALISRQAGHAMRADLVQHAIDLVQLAIVVTPARPRRLGLGLGRARHHLEFPFREQLLHALHRVAGLPVELDVD